ncbi:MFS transporter [Halomicrococcus sp. NG-SE-24]|uniref:MFS transporter n=1 Tax=Halomicrococcus sp. NG-SE-24 TaxID=3436928 RepID=UPI003D964635
MDGNDRRILTVTATGHALVHTFELSIPVFLPVWMEAFDLSVAMAGAVASLGYAAFGIGALPGGVLVDRYGSKPLIAGSLVGMGSAFLALLVVHDVAVFALALVLWGMAASVYHPAGLALISTGVKERGKGFAYHGIAGNVGTALGPLAVVVLLGMRDWLTTVVALAVVAVAAGILAASVGIDEDRALGTESSSTAATDGGMQSFSQFLTTSRRLFVSGFGIVFVAVMFEGIYYRGVLTFLPGIFESTLSTMSIPTGNSSSRYAYSALLLVGTIGQYLGGRLSDRIDPARGLAGVFAALAVAALLFEPLVSLGVTGVAVTVLLFGILLFGEQPLMQATVAEESPPDVRGLTYGYTYLGAFGVGALGAGLTGAFLSASSRTALFIVLAAIATVAAIAGLRVYWRRTT